MFGRRPPRLDDLSDSHRLMKHSKPLCRYCTKKQPIKLVAQRIYTTYFDTFNFYFAKPVNEILSNVSNTPHVVWYKDYQAWDEDGEFLKRYYRRDEVKPRVDILTDFYAFNYKPLHPNLLATDCHQIISKCVTKQDKIFYQRLNKDEQVPNPIYEFQMSHFNSKGNEPEQAFPNKILNSNLSASTYNRPDETSAPRMQPSYETEEHDIYSMNSSHVSTQKRFKPAIKLQGLNLIENLELLTHSQVQWNDQDREIEDVFQNFNNNKSVAHIQRLCHQIHFRLDPVPSIFLKKSQPIVIQDSLSDADLSNFRKSSLRRDSKGGVSGRNTKGMFLISITSSVASQNRDNPKSNNEQNSQSQFHTSAQRLQLSNEELNENNESAVEITRKPATVPIPGSLLPQHPLVTKGKLTRVHSDTSSIQNVLQQCQIKKIDSVPKTPKVVNKGALEVGKHRQPHVKLQSPETRQLDTRINRFIIQETPESIRIQQGNFLLKDQYRGLPATKIQDIAQGYQGSQKSIKGNNISASSIHNQNGSVHINNLSAQQQAIRAPNVKGSLTERISLNSPDSILKHQAQLKDKILQVNQLSAHMVGPIGFNTDRQPESKDRNLIMTYTQYAKSKADLMQFSSLNNETTKQQGNPAFTEEILNKIQDLQAKKLQKNQQGNRIAQMPQKYLIQSQYNTIQTAKQTLSQKAKSTGRNQITSSNLSKNNEKKEQYNHSDVNYLSQRSQDSTVRPLQKPEEKGQKRSAGQQRSQNNSTKTSSHHNPKLLHQPSTVFFKQSYRKQSETTDDPNYLQYSSANISNRQAAGTSLNSSVPVSPLKKFDFKLTLQNLRKEPLQDCLEEQSEDDENQKNYWTERVKNAGGEKPKLMKPTSDQLSRVGLEAYLMNSKQKVIKKGR